MEWWVPCKSGTCVSPSYRENSVPFLTGRHKTNCLCACLNHKNVLAESECLGIFASTTHSGMNRKNRSSYRRSTRQPRTFSSISKMYFLHSFFWIEQVSNISSATALHYMLLKMCLTPSNLGKNNSWGGVGYVCVFNQYFLSRKIGLLITRALEFLEFKEGWD